MNKPIGHSVFFPVQNLQCFTTTLQVCACDWFVVPSLQQLDSLARDFRLSLGFVVRMRYAVIFCMLWTVVQVFFVLQTVVVFEKAGHRISSTVYHTGTSTPVRDCTPYSLLQYLYSTIEFWNLTQALDKAHLCTVLIYQYSSTKNTGFWIPRLTSTVRRLPQIGIVASETRRLQIDAVEVQQ